MRVPDDYDTIQRAVDRAGPGTTIVIDSGRYQEEVLVTTSGITIQGPPHLQTGEGPARVTSIQVIGAEDVTLRSLSATRVAVESSDRIVLGAIAVRDVDGEGGTSSLRISSSGSVQVERLSAVVDGAVHIVDNRDGLVLVRNSGFVDSPLRLRNNRRVIFSEAFFESEEPGETFLSADETPIWVTDSRFDGNGPPRTWVHITGSSGISIAENQVWSCGITGFRVSNSLQTRVEGNRLHAGSCRQFINVEDTPDLAAEGTQCRNVEIDDNRVLPGARPRRGMVVNGCDAVEVDGNRVFNPTHAGIVIGRSTDISVVENRVIGGASNTPTGYGVFFSSGELRDNKAISATSADSGILAMAPESGGSLRVFHNDVIGGWARGISVRSDSVTVECNLVRGNAVGIEVEETAGPDVVVWSNSINRLDGASDYGPATDWALSGHGNWWGGQATAPHPVDPNGEDPFPLDRDPRVSGCPPPPPDLEPPVSAPENRKSALLLPGKKDPPGDLVIEPRFVGEFGEKPEKPPADAKIAHTDLYGSSSLLSEGSTVLDASLSVHGHIPDRPNETRVYQFYLDVGPGGGNLSGRANFTPDLLVQDTRAAPGRAIELFTWDPSIGAYTFVRTLDADVVTGLDLDNDSATDEGLHLRLDLEPFGVVGDPDTGELDPPVQLVYRTVYWQDGRTPWIDEAPDNETVVHHLVPTEPAPVVEVFEADGPSRVPVGTTATVSFRTRLVHDRSPFQGTVNVNRRAHDPDAEGTVAHGLTSDQIGRVTAAVTGVKGTNVGDFISPVGDLTVTFDRLQSVVTWDTRADGRAVLNVSLRYESDGAPVENASVELSGRPLQPVGDGHYHLQDPTAIDSGPVSVSVTTAGTDWPEETVQVPDRPDDLTPTPRVVTETVLVERTVTVRRTSTPGQPGFGPGIALMALVLGVLLLALRRR